MSLMVQPLVLVSGLLTIASAASVHRHVDVKRGIFSDEKCMDDLGCFKITDDFYHPVYRPVNFLPADRESINTKFLLFTRGNKDKSDQLRANNKRLLDSSKFSAKRKTKLITHGFLDSEWLADWMHKMKDEYLASGDYNVIIVDWSGGSTLPYTKATANTRVVGAEIAFLLNWLKANAGVKLEDCHIIGHSLGSHVAGYAGEILKSLGRITGLDPADPYFQYMPPTVRIDPTDAKFVDIIHTDSKSILVAGLGLSQLVGHVDFFPNGGYEQPGCDLSKFKTFITEGLVGGMRNAVACNHHRALDFMRESIREDTCVYTGYVCDGWDHFQGGHCSDCGSKGEKCAILGEKAPQHYEKFKNNPQKSFYLKTGGGTPFCRFQYLISVKVHKDNTKAKKGAMVLKLKGASGQIELKLNDGDSLDFEPGKTYTFVATTDKDPGVLNQLIINWQPGLLGALLSRKVKLESVQITSMNGIDQKTKDSRSGKYCASRLGELARATDHLLTSKDLC